MKWVGASAAILLIFAVLVDAFEVVLLPRRVRHSYGASCVCRRG